MKVLLNKKALAEVLDHAPGYVSAMIRAGYRMQYGTQTSLQHALSWLEENPNFRASHQYPRKKKNQRRQQRRKGLEAVAAGMSGE